MFYFIVFFVFNICVCVQSSDSNNPNIYPYNITLIVPRSAKSATCDGSNNKVFLVRKNEPFNIIFTFNFNTTINNFSCCNSGDFDPCGDGEHNPLYDCNKFQTALVPVIEYRQATIKVTKATEDMNTGYWVCKFIRKDNGKLDIPFQTRVKNIENKPTVTIGGAPTKPIVVPAEEPNYICNYWYNDGELVDLDCSGSSDGKIRLNYLNSTGSKLIETDQIDAERSKLTFRKVMTINNNGDMIDCELEETDNSYSKVVQRTIFQFKNDSIDRVIKISINNETLHPIKTTTKDGVQNLYNYKYLEGDKLKITCLKEKSIAGLLHFGEENNEDLKSNIRKDKNNKLWHQTINLNTTSINKKHLKCIYNGNNLIHTADIEFHLNHRELLIKGLPANNVINEYNKNPSTWIIDYQYTIGEVLNLECVARNKKKKVQWIFEDTHSDTHSYTFLLKDEHDGKTITGKIKGDDDDGEIQRVIIKLHETIKYSESTNKPHKANLYTLDDFVIPGACSLVVIVICVMVACFCSWSKKTKLLRARQNPFENLEQPVLPIPPYPVQWNNRLQNKTNSEEVMTDNILYDSNVPKYANSHTDELDKNAYDKNINKNKHISGIESKINDKTQTIVNNSMYSNDNAPKYSIAHKKPIQNINNKEVPEYHYIESSAVLNLTDDNLKNFTRDPALTRSNINTNDDYVYVEPYATNVHLNTEKNGSNQAVSSNSKEGEYDYTYAGRYANRMACGVNINADT